MTLKPSLQTKLLAMVALPVIATAGLWASSRVSQTQVNERLDQALRWSEHSLAAKEQSLLAAQYMAAAHRSVEGGNGGRRAEAEALGARLLAASEHSVGLAQAFGPDEVAEEKELGEGLAALVETTSRAMAAGQVDEVEGRALLADADLIHARLTARLEERVHEEAEGSREWHALAREAVMEQTRLEFYVAVASALMLLPSLAFSRQLRRSLRALQAGAVRIAARDFSTPVKVSSGDELEKLALLFNQMAAAVENQRTTDLASAAASARLQALEEGRALLERLVGERTTALAGANAGLTQAMAALVAANAAKSRFLATMSHEIRTPLAGVLGTLELLSGSALSREQEEYVALSIGSAKALLAIVNEVLDFSKIEAMGVALELAPFDVWQAAREVRELFLAQATLKGIGLPPVQLTGELWLTGDALRLKQVLSNLLSNAIKFTETGCVRLSAKADREGLEAALRFTVEDTGVGIPAAHRGKLFEPFEQCHGSKHSRFGGTGLGLAISRGLAQAMGGDLTLESAEGVGSRFCFTARLRVADGPGEQVSIGALSAHERAAIQGMRVLVAEDNPVNQLVIFRMLQRLRCEVSLAATGQQALDCLHGAQFDVLLMDIQMPVMDGLAATRALRAAGKRWSQLPVVALTANAFAEDRAACVEAGMTDFLPKPVNEVRLVRTMLNVTGRATPGRLATAS